jgi:hypothetical protein
MHLFVCIFFSSGETINTQLTYGGFERFLDECDLPAHPMTFELLRAIVPRLPDDMTVPEEFFRDLLATVLFDIPSIPPTPRPEAKKVTLVEAKPSAAAAASKNKKVAPPPPVDAYVMKNPTPAPLLNKSIPPPVFFALLMRISSVMAPRMLQHEAFARLMRSVVKKAKTFDAEPLRTNIQSPDVQAVFSRHLQKLRRIFLVYSSYEKPETYWPDEQACMTLPTFFKLIKDLDVFTEIDPCPKAIDPYLNKQEKEALRAKLAAIPYFDIKKRGQLQVLFVKSQTLEYRHWKTPREVSWPEWLEMLTRFAEWKAHEVPVIPWTAPTEKEIRELKAKDLPIPQPPPPPPPNPLGGRPLAEQLAFFLDQQVKWPEYTVSWFPLSPEIHTLIGPKPKTVVKIQPAAAATAAGASPTAAQSPHLVQASPDAKAAVSGALLSSASAPLLSSPVGTGAVGIVRLTPISPPVRSTEAYKGPTLIHPRRYAPSLLATFSRRENEVSPHLPLDGRVVKQMQKNGIFLSPLAYVPGGSLSPASASTVTRMSMSPTPTPALTTEGPVSTTGSMTGLRVIGELSSQAKGKVLSTTQVFPDDNNPLSKAISKDNPFEISQEERDATLATVVPHHQRIR